MRHRLAKNWLSVSLIVALSACSDPASESDGSGGSSTSSSAGEGGGSAGDGGGSSDTSSSSSAGGGGSAGGGDCDPGDVTYAAVAAAESFMATLNATQRAAVSFDFDNDAQRLLWSNLPTGLFVRNGMKLGDMTAAQEAAAFDLLAVILSEKGYQQVVNIVNADEVLRQSTSGGRLVFGHDEYFISIMGTPSATSPWRVQFGGHHLAINATVVGCDITLAPSLTGAQPASYAVSGETIRPQGDELDSAFELIGSLTAAQRQAAVIGDRYIDLVLGPGQDGRVLTPEGIPATELTAAQQALLLALIRERVGILNDEDTAARMADIESHLSETYFAWSGPTTAGSAAYYRITGPTLAIEYSPQAMGGSATNHTHAMYRDPTNDYGAALTP